MAALVEGTLARGGRVSYKHNPDGTQSPYELNINYFDALCNLGEDLPLQEQVDRFLAAQAIMLSLVGVPAIYFHSLFGSSGWPEGVKLTGQNRTVNRQKHDLADLEGELTTPGTRRYRIYQKYKKLLIARAGCPAFHPFGHQRVIHTGASLFSVIRYSPDHDREILCLQNVSNQPRSATIDLAEFAPSKKDDKKRGLDLISRSYISLDEDRLLILEPYQTLWLDISTRE
jgi:sucrose phosphorylase